MRIARKKILGVLAAIGLSGCALGARIDPPAPYGPVGLELASPTQAEVAAAVQRAHTVVLGVLTHVEEDARYSDPCGPVRRLMRGGTCAGLVVAWRATIQVSNVYKGRVRGGLVRALFFAPYGNTLPSKGRPALWFIRREYVRNFLRERDAGAYAPSTGIWEPEDAVMHLVSPAEPSTVLRLP